MPVELPRHQLPRPFFAQLAAGPAAAPVIDRLRAGQLSRRKLQLRALTELLDTGAGDPGRPGSPAHAWAILVTAEHQNPEIVEELLMHPSAGVWLTRSLRKLSGAPADSTPLRTDLDYFSSIAAAAALRCGIPCTISVPVVHGVTTLPTVGQLKLPSEFPAGKAVLDVAADGSGILHAQNGSASVEFSPPEPGPGLRPGQPAHRRTAPDPAFGGDRRPRAVPHLFRRRYRPARSTHWNTPNGPSCSTRRGKSSPRTTRVSPGNWPAGCPPSFRWKTKAPSRARPRPSRSGRSR